MAIMRREGAYEYSWDWLEYSSWFNFGMVGPSLATRADIST